ncbi:MAG: hypothetical protein J5449_07740 [Oscillospiraceae bacterium]|nr:hypothetical protein [Oscillospiraceae bacterium]
MFAGLFGSLFDFNGDGVTDAAEMALGMMILDELDEESDEDSRLEDAGLSRYELEMMGPDERDDALEDAGLDPDDFDF